MFKRSRLLTPLLAALIVAACGGAHPSHPAGRCSPGNESAGCVLAHLPAPLPAQRFSFAPVLARGWDFAWSCPQPTNAAGFRSVDFGASYFSPDRSKNWTRSCVNLYHSNGVATVGVFESSANRAQQGFAAGYDDAILAREQARAVGEPDSRPIDYAIDCPCSPPSIFYYFGGADAGTAHILHIARAAAVKLVGAYGGYDQVRALYLNHVVGHTNWQTYAWSRGLWLPATIAPLEQYLNGSRVDLDRAIARDYGQWPYTPPKPKPHPKPKPPAPKPKPTPAAAQAFNAGFQRGFTVGYDRHRGLNVPDWTGHLPHGHLLIAFNEGFQDGYQAGWKAG